MSDLGTLKEPKRRETPLLIPKARKHPKVSEDALAASICRESFADFVREFWGTIVPEKLHWNWHLDLLCEEMQRLAEDVFAGNPRKYDLVVNISPGTSKSTIMSVMFPAWCWTRMPSFRFIGASYSFPLAMDLSQKCRDVVNSDKYRGYFPDFELRDDQNTKGYFKNTKGGFRYAVGVNGSVTGMHGHFLVVDDPLDPNEAVSDKDMEAANRWIKETLSSRKVDKLVTATVLVMQRLRQGDPTDLFLKKKRVRHVCLPAELTDDVRPEELAEKYVQGLMDPVRLPRDILKEVKDDYGDYVFHAQYLQNPTPRGGGMFKTRKLKWGVPPKKFSKVVRAWDKAGTKGGGAYTVGVLMGRDNDGRFWVLDAIRGQWDSYEREKVIVKTARRDGKNVWVVVEQEPGSGGLESAEQTVRRLAGYKARLCKVDISTGGKLQRADPYSTQMNAGNVWLPEDQRDPDGTWSHDGWAKDWVEEHRHFPHGTFKDQVDASALAFIFVGGKRRRLGAVRRREMVEQW